MAIKVSHINTTVPSAAKEKQQKSSILQLLNQDISFSKSYPDKKKEQFYSEISLLLSAGTDIKTALELIVEETEKDKDKKLLEGIKNDIINGASFSEALQHTGKFTEYEYYSLKVGEESSRVDLVLTDLATFFKRKIDQKRKLSGALSYPIVLLLTAFGMVVFLLKFLVPMFQDIFKSFNKELPGVTQFVIDASDTVSSYFLLIVLFILGAIVFVMLNKKKMWFRKITSTLIIKIPVVGEMAQKIYLTRFCHSMNLLISARNPLLNSIQLVKKMIAYYPLQQALEKVEDDLMHGKLLNESMRTMPIFPKKMIALIKVAEEVNKLDAIFKNLDEQYSKDLEYRSELFGKLLEPFVILFISVIVGFIVIAMYIPMMEINTGLF
ncbi:MAG: type II secretion system F family protein [Flavobacteriales bacterium]|nr:type II secretion system F family protein [Flavobacteriales bacterium]MCW8937645.1 type II secretion system F family protein [Flavobacteriales bacterium]MCW8969390.1 type II secretion system F family protein [Flavobacteriales bacterium]MCW8990133.1 type II secretion system F family protein [Flavobacteriales bacterium]MCW9019851.1 type II secretion system F family protein [Flavobacteriales bacterium]